jgi:acid phosphatase (class A)
MIRSSLIAFALLAASSASAQTAPPLIDGVALAGPPPAPESAEAASDRLAMRQAPSAERLAQAVADLAFDPWRAFAPALDDRFTQERFPATARVLSAVTAAISGPINAAKAEFDRPRPFAVDRTVMQCDALPANPSTGGSYPTGHGAAGWAWALTLAELAPARADAILQRGRDFGDSRVICGYHFPSDVEAARLIAAGVVARLHAEPGYRRDLDAARRELSRVYGIRPD